MLFRAMGSDLSVFSHGAAYSRALTCADRDKGTFRYALYPCHMEHQLGPPA